jgi:glycine hydroxymethyltransferase
MLVDVTPLGLTGKIAEQSLDKSGITVNKNMIPFDQRKALVTSGIRVGTAAVTTRGMGETEMAEIASLIGQALQATDDEQAQREILRQVHALCARFPLYAEH